MKLLPDEPFAHGMSASLSERRATCHGCFALRGVRFWQDLP